MKCDFFERVREGESERGREGGRERECSSISVQLAIKRNYENTEPYNMVAGILLSKCTLRTMKNWICLFNQIVYI